MKKKIINILALGTIFTGYIELNRMEEVLVAHSSK
jgi:hypothetical protein